MEGLSLATILVGGGGCATLGGIIVALINGLFGRAEQKATAAEQLSQSAASLTERWEVANKGLREELAGVKAEMKETKAEIRSVKDVIGTLVDRVDEVIPLLEQAGHAQIAVDLRDANRTVRRVI